MKPSATAKVKITFALSIKNRRPVYFFFASHFPCI
jgi:hypothetical protein